MFSSSRATLGILLVAYSALCTAPEQAVAQVCAPWVVVDTGGPSFRRYPAITFDERRREMVYFGGYTAHPERYFGDTWEHGGTQWTQRFAAGPAPRLQHAMTYDSRRGVVVLFGGGDRLNVFGDTWEWDGQEWSLRSSLGPSPRIGHAMTFDKRRGVVVMFGGNGSSGYLGDTWEWDGDQWALVAQSGPSPREASAIAYDELRGVSVLHGGLSQIPGSSSETWEWDGVTWRLGGRFVGTFGALWGHAMVFDARSGNVVSVTRNSEETWAWDGVSWRFLLRPLPYELSVGPQGIGYDHQRGVIILVSGNETSRTTATAELPSCPLDSDDDGLPDPYDSCDHSDLRETISIDDCESEIENHLFQDGCTMMDRITECEAEAKNHGDFVTCVGDLAHEWADGNVIDANQKGNLIHCAAQADAPLRRAKKMDRAHPTRPQTESVEPLTQP